VLFRSPLADPGALAALLTLEIEAHPPTAAVTGVAISARVTARRAAPGGLWQPPAPAPRDLAGVLARLAALVGGANVGAPVALDSHRPDACTLTPFVPPAADDPRAQPAASPTASEAEIAAREPGAAGEAAAGALALRRLRPPRPVAVQAADGRPLRVSAAGALDVLTCAGPWRLSGEWWDADVWARDEWDVALADGTVWRLVHDRLRDAWALDGVYD